MRIMKCVFYVMVISILSACAADTQKMISEKEKKNMNSAKNALKYKGTYIGTTLTESGDKIKITIDLSDSLYKKNVEFVEQRRASIKGAGVYEWNEDGTMIVLLNEDQPNTYLVQKNTLIRLDISNNNIGGDTRDNYILKK